MYEEFAREKRESTKEKTMRMYASNLLKNNLFLINLKKHSYGIHR